MRTLVALLLAIPAFSQPSPSSFTTMSKREMEAFHTVSNACRADVEYLCNVPPLASSPLGFSNSGWGYLGGGPMHVVDFGEANDAEQDNANRQMSMSFVSGFDQRDVDNNAADSLNEMNQMIDFFFSRALSNPLDELFDSDHQQHSMVIVFGRDGSDASSDTVKDNKDADSIKMIGPVEDPAEKLVQNIAAQTHPAILSDVSRLVHGYGNTMLNERLHDMQEDEDHVAVRTARRLTAVTPEELLSIRQKQQQQAFLPFGCQSSCLQRAYQSRAVSNFCGTAIQRLESIRALQVQEHSQYSQQQEVVFVHLLVFYSLIVITAFIMLVRRHMRISSAREQLSQKRGLKLRILRAIYSRPTLKVAVENELKEPIGRVPPVAWWALHRMMLPHSSVPSSLTHGYKFLLALLLPTASLLFVLTMPPLCVLRTVITISAVLFLCVSWSCCFSGRADMDECNGDTQPMCTCCCCGATTSMSEHLLTNDMKCCSCCQGTGVCSVSCADCCGKKSHKNKTTNCPCCDGKGCCCCDGSGCSESCGCCGDNCCCGDSCCCGDNCCCGDSCCCGDNCCCKTKKVQTVKEFVYEGVPLQIV